VNSLVDKQSESSSIGLSTLALRFVVSFIWEAVHKPAIMSERTLSVVYTKQAPEPLPVFCQAIKSENTVFCSGQIGMNPSTMKVVEGTVADRLKQIISNLRAVLTQAGSNLENILKVTIFLTDMNDFTVMNEAYKFLLPDPKPARTCIAVKSLPLNTDIEVECIAFVDGNGQSNL